MKKNIVQFYYSILSVNSITETLFESVGLAVVGKGFLAYTPPTARIIEA